MPRERAPTSQRSINPTDFRWLRKDDGTVVLQMGYRVYNSLGFEKIDWVEIPVVDENPPGSIPTSTAATQESKSQIAPSEHENPQEARRP